MITIKEIYEAMRNGDVLTDAEIEVAIDHFQQLSDLTVVLGDVFHLARVEATNRLTQLQGWQRAREQVLNRI